MCIYCFFFFLHSISLDVFYATENLPHVNTSKLNMIYNEIYVIYSPEPFKIKFTIAFETIPQSLESSAQNTIVLLRVSQISRTSICLATLQV